jgi:hypothetical protein
MRPFRATIPALLLSFIFRSTIALAAPLESGGVNNDNDESPNLNESGGAAGNTSIPPHYEQAGIAGSSESPDTVHVGGEAGSAGNRSIEKRESSPIGTDGSHCSSVGLVRGSSTYSIVFVTLFAGLLFSRARQRTRLLPTRLLSTSRRTNAFFRQPTA